jgi:hypothetical protein
MLMKDALAVRPAKFASGMDYKFGDDRGLRGRLTLGIDDRLSRYAVTYQGATLNALVEVISKSLGPPQDRYLLLDLDDGLPFAALHVWESETCDLRLTVLGSVKVSPLFPVVRRGLVLERLSDARRASPDEVQRAAELLK